MSNLYDWGRQSFLEGYISWLTDDIRVCLVNTVNYNVNLATHQTLADVPVAAVMGTSGALAGKTSTAGVADADDVVFSSTTAQLIGAAVIYKYNAVRSNARLIGYISSAINLPALGGGPFQFVWDNGPDRIFKL
jgi:hypothetical protein